jgi:hypothetical protein
MTQVLIVAAVATMTTGCSATAPPVTAGPSQSREAPSPSPTPSPVMYDAEQAESLMLTAADTFDLARAGLAINSWSPSTVTSAFTDVYSEWVVNTYPSPVECGPVYWLVATGKAERDSTDPFVMGPHLDGVASDVQAPDVWDVTQGVRLFATPEAAQTHFDKIVAAAENCAQYEVGDEDNTYGLEQTALPPMTSDTIHFRETSTPYYRVSLEADLTPIESDKWVLRQGNLLVFLDGQQDASDISALAGIVKARLDSLGSHS